MSTIVVEEIITIRTDSSIPPPTYEGKVCIADIWCKSNAENIFIVEMQLTSHEGFPERVDFYSSRTFCDSIKSEEEYRKLKPVYLIVVCGFNMFPRKSWYSHHQMIDVFELKKYLGQPLSQDMICQDFKMREFVVLQLPKFNESIDTLDSSMKWWMFYFKNASNLSEEEIASIRQKNTVVNSAIEALRRNNFTEEEYNIYATSEDLLRLENGKRDEVHTLKSYVMSS